jgi:hypothetical protein
MLPTTLLLQTRVGHVYSDRILIYVLSLKVIVKLLSDWLFSYVFMQSANSLASYLTPYNFPTL